jgi:hypothetical protein
LFSIVPVKIRALQKKRVIFFDSNKCNFLKHSKLVRFNKITILNVDAQNEKLIFWFKIFKFNPKLWILKTDKNYDHIRDPLKILIRNGRLHYLSVNPFQTLI